MDISIAAAPGSVDSRLVKPGDLFFALEGEQVDGHDFLEEAARRGAIGAVVSEKYEGDTFGLELIRVPNVFDALQEAGRRRCLELDIPIVAVTGTVGKTTTKDFIATLLRRRYRVYASPKSYNSQRTVPLNLLRAPADAEVLVLEMAMSEPGHLARLVEIAPPTIAVLLSVHGNHPTLGLEGIRKAKEEIFGSSKTRVKIRPEDIELLPEFEWHIPGKHNWFNLSAAAMVAREMGLTDEEIMEGAKECRLPDQRCQFLEKGGVTIVNDTYNAACSASVIAALDALPKVKGRRIAVLSEMVEIGHFTESAHREVAEHARGSVDELLCLGEAARAMCEGWDQARWFSDRSELLTYLKGRVTPGDVVLFKGARSHRLEELVEAL